MSKTINNYRGRHRGWKQNRILPTIPESKGPEFIQGMWVRYAIKMARFMKSRAKWRDALAIKGKKSLTGKKRAKALDNYFDVAY